MALDIEEPAALLAYLRARRAIDSDELPAVRVLTGGVSNRTVLVQRANGQDWVIKQALSKLRVEVDWFSSPERIHREALGLRWIGSLAPGRTPMLVFEDPRRHLVCMDAVPEPHANWKTRLLAGRLELGHVRAFGSLLGRIHGEARRHVAEVSVVFEDRSYFESLRIEPYFLFTAERVPESASFIRDVVDATRANRWTLVHGDYSPKNVLVRGAELTLLDHEVVHYGDPAFDVAFALTHLLSKMHHLPGHRTSFARAALVFWETYIGAMEPVAVPADIEKRAVRSTLACMLARVRGRSPLEYLGAEERTRQCAAVLALMRRTPESLTDLVADFGERL